MDDLYTKKCEKFSDVTKENFERIKDLRAESLGDKVYDDETIELVYNNFKPVIDYFNYHFNKEEHSSA